MSAGQHQSYAISKMKYASFSHLVCEQSIAPVICASYFDCGWMLAKLINNLQKYQPTLIN